MTSSVRQAGESAKRAAHALASQPPEALNRVLLSIADLLEANGGSILESNQLELAEARQLVSSGELSSAAVDRLRLSPQAEASK